MCVDYETQDTYPGVTASQQNMADSTDAVGWSPILPSVKSVGNAERHRRCQLVNKGNVRKNWSEILKILELWMHKQ